MSDLLKENKHAAISAKPVLKLIIAAIANDQPAIKDVSLQIANEFELNGKQELALYIYAQYNLVNTFEITD